MMPCERKGLIKRVTWMADLLEKYWRSCLLVITFYSTFKGLTFVPSRATIFMRESCQSLRKFYACLVFNSLTCVGCLRPRLFAQLSLFGSGLSGLGIVGSKYF